MREPDRGSLLHTLRRKRQLRANVTQLLFVIAGVVLGLAVPRITTGSTVEAAAVRTLLFGLSAAVIPFVGIVFSLLFLVVQFGNTALTPRLNIFRDNPLVWRSFGYFLGVFVGCAVAGLAIGSDRTVSVLVPIVAISAALGILVVFRALQFAGFRSIQFAPILRDIAERGRAVIDALYTEPYEEHGAGRDSVPPVTSQVRWPHHNAILQQIDLPALRATAERSDSVVELRLAVGDLLREGDVVAQIRSTGSRPSDGAVLASLTAGMERTFDQDPRFAFRLLVDIALRALSPAINDQTTGVQVIDAVDGLLAALATRELDVGLVGSADGTLRVMLSLPSWEDYLELAVDEIAVSAVEVPTVLARIDRMLSELAASAPEARRPALERRRQQPSRDQAAVDSTSRA
jgi:uncharacterized membrane protein